MVGLLAGLVTGCGSDDNSPDAPTPSGAVTGTVAPLTPLPEKWITQRFTEPVLESDASGVPFTEVPNNPKGELLPPNTQLDGPVMWQAVGCQALAFSADAGPTTRTQGGWPSGWSRTDKGAALAAWSIAILFEVMPDREEFTSAYLVGGGDRSFVRSSEVRDPRAGVRASNWKNAAQCFRSAAVRRVDLDVAATLTDNDSRAAVRFYSPKYKVTWDFPLVWDESAQDWKATADGFAQYWKTVDDPTERPIDAEFSW